MPVYSRSTIFKMVWCILWAYLMNTVGGYKPVIIVHGLFDASRSLSNFSRFIHQSHPVSIVIVIDLYDHFSSVECLWKLVDGFRQYITPIMQNASDGVHLICFSQGGLICRGLLSVLSNHNVHSFISLSSPQAGQYGETVYLKHWKFLKSQVYRICYRREGQRISICNYWKDPHHLDKYLKSSNFLALLNGERLNSEMAAWKTNFLRIKKLVLIGGPDDGVITPWESSHFGFYDEHEHIIEMKEQEVYVKDTFGLKTVDTRGDLVTCVFPGVHHTKWHSDETVYRACIEQWLV